MTIITAILPANSMKITPPVSGVEVLLQAILPKLSSSAFETNTSHPISAPKKIEYQSIDASPSILVPCPFVTESIMMPEEVAIFHLASQHNDIMHFWCLS
jgi:hypothetical protein